MDAATTATSILLALGLNKYVAMVVPMLAIMSVLASLLMQVLPKPGEARWYVVLYSIVRYAAMNFGKAAPAAPGAMTVAKTPASN